MYVNTCKSLHTAVDVQLEPIDLPSHAAKEEPLEELELVSCTQQPPSFYAQTFCHQLDFQVDLIAVAKI